MQSLPTEKRRGHEGQGRTESFNAVDHVAERLDVSTRTVRRWIERGDLIAHRFGAVIRIAESDLRAFLARHRET